MRRTFGFAVCGLCLSLGIACGGRAGADRSNANDAKIDIAKTAPIIEKGCLTASGDRFVLTSLEPGAGETQMYQLVGKDDELRPYIGTQVRVTGDAEPARVAEVRETAPAEPAGTARNQSKRPVGTSGQTQPTVKTEADVKLETRTLRVATVAATGDDCTPIRGQQQNSPTRTP